MGWATFWAIFSQTHLVTLLPGGYVNKELSAQEAILFSFTSSEGVHGNLYWRRHTIENHASKEEKKGSIQNVNIFN
jgi:hypothetical protein